MDDWLNTEAIFIVCGNVNMLLASLLGAMSTEDGQA